MQRYYVKSTSSDPKAAVRCREYYALHRELIRSAYYFTATVLLVARSRHGTQYSVAEMVCSSITIVVVVAALTMGIPLAEGMIDVYC